ncbi:MAG: hypothetical protein GWN99_09730 [Gemmatimonadetes bacterium]|uniref:Yip1 domain-containing protein n=1 Tax=Candidatus Kutchimonas denitrificans TaxID=3056748 RepID=A0AAE5CA41_9BACT|nr:hypothetical protein [Gemmatimonadota bacterium]NIR74147.1 hypothetical protein [Candidatus Kutchimonas denitrificans]NIS01329.1 hypothetical protein [Gemmatimonadota bacterium]NIT67060.1 hypothetical protein [Gemmatimonadota bacterium]NIU51720.1 hypothetical protein [Gemmatimonadota bacterium]
MSAPPTNCPRCGAPTVPGDRLCFSCGQVLSDQPRTEPAARASEEDFTLPAAPAATPGPAAEERRGDIDSAGTVRPPWEDRARFGFWLALWLTWRDSVFRPVDFFRKLPPRTGLGPAIGYIMLLSGVALAFNIYWDTVRTVIAGGAEGGVLVTLFSGLLLLVFGGAFILAIYLGLLFVMVGLLHLGCMVAGAGRRGYEATFRATAYAAGPAAFAIFPFFGPLIGMIWGTVLLYIAVREVQRTTNGRTVLAFVVPLVAVTAFFMFLGILAALILATTDLDTAV